MTQQIGSLVTQWVMLPTAPDSIDEETVPLTVVSFDDWYGVAWPQLMRVLVPIVGDRSMAEDVAATACSRALERWATLENPSAWTYTVALNEVRRSARRRAAEEVLWRRRSDRPRTATEERAGLSPEVWRAVRALPLRQREVVVLRYVADMTQGQIAATLDIAPGSVASALHDARRALELALQLGKEGSDHA